MQIRNVKTHNLDWLMYLIEKKSDTISVYDPVNGPVTDYLGHINGLYVVQDTITEALESLDVASIFNRESGNCSGCCSFKFFQPLSAPHMAAVAAVWLEATIVVVCLLVIFGEIVPSSTDKIELGVFFLANYFVIALSVLVTPYGIKLSMLGSMLSNRVMVPINWLLYLRNASRFGVTPRCSACLLLVCINTPAYYHF